MAWTSVFPYIYSMIKSFPTSTSNASDPSTPTTISQSADQRAAVWAGILVSVFTFGEFLMAPQWARISDQFGRKPTLLAGSMLAVISALTFGCSRSLPVAVVTRCFAGLANPNLGIVQTFTGERVGRMPEHQGKWYGPILTWLVKRVGWCLPA